MIVNAQLATRFYATKTVAALSVFRVPSRINASSRSGAGFLWAWKGIAAMDATDGVALAQFPVVATLESWWGAELVAAVNVVVRRIVVAVAQVSQFLVNFVTNSRYPFLHS